MGIDMTGGLADEREFVFAAQPDNPEMRESVNAWIWDGGDDVAMPRIGVEAVADQWDTHEVHVNVTTGDGRVFNLWAQGEVHDPLGSDGKARVLGAGPLSFELIEPFRHWRMRLVGDLLDGTVDAQIAGVAPPQPPSIPVEIEIDLRSAAPPWEQGALLPEARRVLETQDEGALLGGPRFEQLARATGTARIDGVDYDIDGGALRVRRQGIRRLGTFRGHAWQSALFPSGRGFGCLVYPPRDDGLPTFNEGFVFEGDGDLVPARVVDAPWLRTLQGSGQDVSLVLETDDRTVEIAAESVMSNFMVMRGVGSNPNFPVLQQAIARYTLDGESTNGMLERSMPSDQVEIP